MQRRGINFVRTGLWTAWSRAMRRPRRDRRERVLVGARGLRDTAARHGIVVCFNFFAFLPPAFTGDNPYLDPRAIEGQREMLTLFATRYRGNGWIHWDLINEPSYAPRAALWSTRAIGDEHEKRAWASWVRARHGDDAAKLRALWHDPSADPMSVPATEDFAQAFVQVARRPRKVRDFQEFAQEVVAGWAARMRDILHAAGGDPLVTLGQDEGGIDERPTQQLMAASLDYTAVHTWWKNDDLLWDGVTTKVPEKPSLHQETGLMRLEDVDGTPWRSPEDAARLLERKLAYAFAGRGTGVVEWAWNVNPYMPIDEEATIGLFRPDGTAKPELDPIVALGAFFRTAAPLLDDFEADPVVLVVPHARAFLGRTERDRRDEDRRPRARRALRRRADGDLRPAADTLRGSRARSWCSCPAPTSSTRRRARAPRCLSRGHEGARSPERSRATRTASRRRRSARSACSERRGPSRSTRRAPGARRDGSRSRASSRSPCAARTKPSVASLTGRRCGTSRSRSSSRANASRS